MSDFFWIFCISLEQNTHQSEKLSSFTTRNSPSPSPRLSRLTSTRNSVPTRAGANPRSSRLATRRTPSVKSSTADGPNWASLALGRRERHRYPVVHCRYCAPRMTAPPSRSSRAPSPRCAGSSGYPSFWNVLIIETILLAVPPA